MFIEAKYFLSIESFGGLFNLQFQQEILFFLNPAKPLSQSIILISYLLLLCLYKKNV
nr:MAG TPA: hypothetical protein [Caudoviricetes sp.]